MPLVRMQQRRDTAANWLATNPVLASGEVGFETDTGNVKIGDGVSAWLTLIPASIATSIDVTRLVVGAGGPKSTTTEGMQASGTETLLFQPLSQSANVAGKIAVAGKGIGQAGGTRAEVRVYMGDGGGDNVDLESHNDADGALRYRVVTRIEPAGSHYPFYFQIGGNNSLYIDDTAGILVSSAATAGGFSWVTQDASRGDIVVGVNQRGVRGVNSGNTGSLALIATTPSNAVLVGGDGNQVALGSSQVTVSQSAGALIHPVGAYSAASTSPNVNNANYLHIANNSKVTITNFANGVQGQPLVLTFADGNTDVSRANALLQGSAVFSSTTGATLLLIKGPANWHEVSRSTTNG